MGYERIQEIADPSLSLDRARAIYKKQGRSDKWLAQRMTGQETRNKLAFPAWHCPRMEVFRTAAPLQAVHSL